jgi:stage II sporulation protein R
MVAKVANQVLRAHHASYRARVLWTHTAFPTKAYGTWVLPAGRYQALLIVLGRGDGHNWWCVLYPSLCFVDMGNALAVRSPQALPVAGPLTPVHHAHGHAARNHGRIRVSWTTPRFILTFLAILR